MEFAATFLSLRRVRAFGKILRSKIFWQEALRTLVAWCAVFVIVVWMVICQQWSDLRWIRRFEHNTKQSHHSFHRTNTLGPPWPSYMILQDQLLERLPLLENRTISDKLVGSSAAICIIGCGILCAGWRERLMLLRRIGWIAATMYFIRSITISVTTMPPSLTSCEITEPRNMWQVILSTPGIISGNITQCTDKVFSGHTAIFTLSFLLWHMYATHWAFIAYSMVHTIAGILSVLMVRYHYTVDVIIGFLMVCLIHRTYFTSLDLAVRQRRYNDYATVPQEMAENHRDQASNSTDSDSSIPFGSREDSFDVYKLEVITQSLNCIDSDGSSTLHGKDSAIISNSSNYNASINVGAHTPTALSYPAANHSDIQEMIERSASISKKRETSISTASSVANGKIENPNLMLQESKQQAHNNPDIKNASILVNHPANADPHYITQNSIEIAAPHITTTSSMATGGSNTSQFVATCVKYEEEGAGNAADEQLLPQSATPRDTQTEQTSWSQFEDNNYLSSNIFNQGDYVGMMGVNRSPGTLLPRIVAWMDGLDLRYK